MASTKTREEMKDRGFMFSGIETCRGPRCGARMEIWKPPNPTEKVQVMDAEGIFQSHFVTCPDREMFRRKKPPAGRKADSPKTGVLF